MSESTTPAQTSDDLWNKARDAGLFSTTQGTNAFDLAIDRFAAAERATIPAIKDGGTAFPAQLPSAFVEIDERSNLIRPIGELTPGMTLRAYFAAHADISEFDLEDHVLEIRASHATYTNEPASAKEIADAVADLKLTQADALILRLARGTA